MHAHHSFLTLLTQLPSLLYLLERMSSSLRALLTPLDTDTAGRPQRYSTTVLLAVTGGAVLASALYAHALVRKALLARDAPPSQTDPLAHFNRCLQRRIDREEARKRNNSSSSSSSSSAAPSSSSPAAIDDDTDPESFDIRVATVADAAEIAFQTAESFNNFNQSVGLALEFPDLQSARDMVDHDLQYTAAFVAVRRRDQAILCSVFNHEFDILGGAVGCGPWSTKWGSLSKGVGRRMIEFVVATSLRHGARSLRLNQIAANLPAHSLYTSMGFESREPLHLWSGTMNASYLQAEIDSLQSQFSVRAMTERDLATCDAMHQDALGISRKNTLAHDFRDKEAKWIVTDKRGNIWSVPLLVFFFFFHVFSVLRVRIMRLRSLCEECRVIEREQGGVARSVELLFLTFHFFSFFF